MKRSTLNIRFMKIDDFDAVVGIGKKVLKASRLYNIESPYNLF